MPEIESESRFVWKSIFYIIITPITFILILFGKKTFKDLFRPFFYLYRFLIEPKFTISIIAINIVTFIISVFFLSEKIFVKLVSYPSDILSIRAYSLITSGFLHANWGHLLGNMLGILLFGRIIEKKLGPLKTGLIYFGALLISGIFTSLIHLTIIKDNTGGIGASGALMGLVSSAILLAPFYITYELIIPMPVMLCGWIIIYADISGIINPIEDGIGHFAHIGGFISIAILLFLFSKEDRQSLKKGLVVNLISLAVFAVLYLFVVK